MDKLLKEKDLIVKGAVRQENIRFLKENFRPSFMKMLGNTHKYSTALFISPERKFFLYKLLCT